MLKYIQDLFRRREHDSERQSVVLPPPPGESEFAAAMERSPAVSVLLLVFVWGICAFLLALIAARMPTEHDLVSGQRAPRTLLAAFDFSYENAHATNRAREQAASAAPLFYSLSPQATQQIEERTRNLLLLLERSPSGNIPPNSPLSALSRELREKLEKNLDDTEFREKLKTEMTSLLNQGILLLPPGKNQPPTQLLRIVDASQRERLPRLLSEQPDVRQAARILARLWLPDGTDRGMLLLWQEIIAQTLGNGNLLPDEARTAAERLALADKVDPVQIEVKKNQPIVRKRDVVDDLALARLKTYGTLAANRTDEYGSGWVLAGHLFWSFILLAFTAFYLIHVHPEVVRSNRKLALLVLSTTLTLFLNYFAMEIFFFSVGEMTTLPQELLVLSLPVALASVLLASALGYRVALWGGFFVATITAMMMGQALDFVVRAALISSILALAVRNANNYRSFFLRILLNLFPLLWLLNTDLLHGAYGRPEFWSWCAWSLLLAFTNALATAIIALLTMFLFELLFNVTTNMSLMVLCDYNHPLLERLKREAPGTFFHSMMVATMAEDASGIIGANPLRAKSAALYHDIGKLIDPQYFTENNLNSINRHLDLAPRVSSNIIRGHVTSGLALAHRYKLCRLVRDAIEQHHGTDTVRFFYQKALERGENPDIADFRYTGRLPMEKEIVIVSLADCCEAACRSIDAPTEEKLDNVVSEIFRTRFRDGQLNHAKLTLAELEDVRKSLINTLMSMKHGRIAYHRDATNHGNKLPLERPSPQEPVPPDTEKTDPPRR